MPDNCPAHFNGLIYCIFLNQLIFMLIFSWISAFQWKGENYFAGNIVQAIAIHWLQFIWYWSKGVYWTLSHWSVVSLIALWLFLRLMYLSICFSTLVSIFNLASYLVSSFHCLTIVALLCWHENIHKGIKPKKRCQTFFIQ